MFGQFIGHESRKRIMSKKLPNIKTQFSNWYNEVIYQAELVDQAPVRGTMVVRPYGWAIWEQIKSILDYKIRITGHQNASFPLLIPESFFKREADHVKGFSPELAIVTIAGGKKLEEPLVIRPTSETIIHYSFARWIKSWRDLPMKINQWANVVRWEMRTRPFIRTSEFFWQEGHTAHETLQEAEQEVQLMLNEYVDLAQNYLAIPVITGQKSENEKFAGADATYTFEAIMQDGKALQMGTSHLISRSFARAFNMQYQDREGNLEYPYLTSWGVTTRLVGALVMTHGDEKGLVIPPRIAPIQIVVIPILIGDKEKVLATARTIIEKLRSPDVHLRVELDDDETKTPGSKFYKWELKGVPLRIEIGPKDLDKNEVTIVTRLGYKTVLGMNDVSPASMVNILGQIQHDLYERAQDRLQEMWHQGEFLDEFGPELKEHNGAYQTGWCGSQECEAKLKEYQASIRCLLPDKTFASCCVCRQRSEADVIVAKAY